MELGAVVTPQPNRTYVIEPLMCDYEAAIGDEQKAGLFVQGGKVRGYKAGTTGAKKANMGMNKITEKTTKTVPLCNLL